MNHGDSDSTWGRANSPLQHRPHVPPIWRLPSFYQFPSGLNQMDAGRNEKIVQWHLITHSFPAMCLHGHVFSDRRLDHRLKRSDGNNPKLRTSKDMHGLYVTTIKSGYT